MVCLKLLSQTETPVSLANSGNPSPGSLAQKIKMTTAARLQADGQSECTIRSLVQMMKAYVDHLNPVDWDDHISLPEFSLRITILSLHQPSTLPSSSITVRIQRYQHKYQPQKSQLQSKNY
jgi:hypothetical protein